MLTIKRQIRVEVLQGYGIMSFFFSGTGSARSSSTSCNSMLSKLTQGMKRPAAIICFSQGYFQTRSSKTKDNIQKGFIKSGENSPVAITGPQTTATYRVIKSEHDSCRGFDTIFSLYQNFLIFSNHSVPLMVMAAPEHMQKHWL